MIKCSSTYNIKKSRFLLHRCRKRKWVDHAKVKRDLAVNLVENNKTNNLRNKNLALIFRKVHP